MRNSLGLNYDDNYSSDGASYSQGGFGDYMHNWLQSFKDEPMSVFEFAGQGTTFTEDANVDDYLAYIWQENPEFYESVYTPAQLKMIKNSESTADVDFKVRWFGAQQEALERIEHYDEQSNAVTYGLTKTVSAIGNYVAMDPATLPSLFLGGSIIKGAQAIGQGSKAMTVALSVAAGTAEGAAYGWLYENNRVNYERQMGNEDAAIDNTIIGWGAGLGAVGGLMGSAFLRGAADDNKVLAALADEMGGMPQQAVRRPGTIDELSNLVKSQKDDMDAINLAFKGVGAKPRNYATLWSSSAMRVLPFKNTRELADWVATAKPSKRELDQLSEAVTELQLKVDTQSSVSTAAMKKLPDTEYQKTGVMSREAQSVQTDDILEGIADQMNINTSVGLLKRIPGSQAVGRFLTAAGTFGVRGGGVRKAAGVSAYLYQSVIAVGMRNVDQTVTKVAAVTIDGARRTVEGFFGKDLGITKLLLKNSKEATKAADEGATLVSDMVGSMQGAASNRPWLNELGAKLKEGFEAMGRRAEEAGLIDAAKDYFPILFNRGAITADTPGFRKALTSYLTKKFTGKKASLNMITLRDLGWVDYLNGKLVISKLGKEMGITDLKQLRGGLSEAAETAYAARLPAMLEKQARRSADNFEGVGHESLLINPDSLEEGAVMVRKGFRTDSTHRQTFDKDIYLDDGMKPFMEQNIGNMYQHVTTNLGARTEFALGQAAIFGRPVEFGELAARARNIVARDKDLTAQQKKEFMDMIDEAESVYDFNMGNKGLADSPFDLPLVRGVSDTAISVTRGFSSYLWGIPVVSMEMVQKLLAPSTIHALGSNLNTIRKAVMSSEYRWEMLSAFGEAIDATRLVTRGMLENAGHQGQFLGYLPSERMKAPWINVARGLIDKQADGIARTLPQRLGSVVPNVAAAASTNITQIGMMPVLTAAGRIMTGRYSESFVTRKLNALRTLADKLDELGEVTPKQFNAMARKAGFKNANDAALLNRAGLMDKGVRDFMLDLRGAGLFSKKGLDSEKILRWAQKNGKEDEYFRFSGAMTEYVTERMNNAFATPSPMSRVALNDKNPLMQLMTMFWNFPAAFYQQRLMMAGGDDSLRGTGLLTSYIALEGLHRSIRDVVDPRSDSFGSLEGVMDEWKENPGKSAYRLFTGSLPITGLYPLGSMGGTTLFGQPLELNIAEGKMEKVLKGIGDAANPESYNQQAALEWSTIFNNTNAAR